MIVDYALIYFNHKGPTTEEDEGEWREFNIIGVGQFNLTLRPGTISSCTSSEEEECAATLNSQGWK